MAEPVRIVGGLTEEGIQARVSSTGELHTTSDSVDLHQTLDSSNTKTVTAAVITATDPWVGVWTKTRSIGVVRILVVLSATDNTEGGLGGTFTFQFSENGVIHNGISESRVITDFQTVRDFDLLNAGEYFKVKFTPNRALAGDTVSITTTLRKQNDGSFARIADQQIEKANAAMPQTFAYLKGFGLDGRSEDFPISSIDTNNSSTANLSGGATFTGTAVPTVGYTGIQVTLKTDQSCAVYIEQSQDGTNWGISDQYDYNKTRGTFGVTVQSVSSYWRVRVTNINSTTATTFFRLQSGLDVNTQSIPRALDEYGNLKVAVQSIRDRSGPTVDVSHINESGSYTNYRLTGKSFGAVNDPKFWTLAKTGTGSVATEANGIATLTSGTSNSGYGQLASFRQSRFITSIPNKFRAIIKVPTVVVANNIRRWGAYNISGLNVPSNGFYFELSSTGVLSICHVANGSITSVASGSFNGPRKDFYTLDTNVHAYDIRYFVARANFYIDGDLVHTFTPTTTRMTEQLDLKIHALSINSAGGTTSGTLEVWLAAITRLGLAASSPISVYQESTTTGIVLKRGAGNMHRIAVSGVQDTSVITLYDNTAASGTIIWSSGIMGKETKPFSINLEGVPFFTGLTLVIASANSIVTAVFE